MRITGLVWAAASCICLAMAQEPVPGFRVGGVVANASTGEPVRRAMLTLEFVAGKQPGQAAQTQIADAGGHFEFVAVPAGQYRLRAERRGYPKQEYLPGTGLAVSEDTTGISFRMEPFAAVTGTVADENGDPIQGAEVHMIRSELQAGSRELRPAGSVLTDDRGQYRVAQLTKGRYYISASARAQAVNESAVYARRYFPGTADLRSAAALDLEPGSNQRADFRLQPEPAFHIRGQVLGAQDTTGLSVQLMPHPAAELFGASGYPVQITGPKTFDVSGVPPGQYLLTANASRKGAVEQAAQLVFVAMADIDGVVLTPAPVPEVTGRVTVEQPADGKQGTPPLRPERVAVTLYPADSVTQPVLAIPADAEGVLHGPRASPGNYTLWVNVPEPYYLKSSGAAIQVQPNSAASLEIVIGAGGGQVTGTVTSAGKPAARCTVLLAHSGASPAHNKLAVTDAAGKFQFNAVAPGPYTAYAWRDVTQVEYRNPDVLAQAAGVSVTVTEGGKHTADLQLIAN